MGGGGGSWAIRVAGISGSIAEGSGLSLECPGLCIRCTWRRCTSELSQQRFAIQVSTSFLRDGHRGPGRSSRLDRRFAKQT